MSDPTTALKRADPDAFDMFAAAAPSLVGIAAAFCLPVVAQLVSQGLLGSSVGILIAAASSKRAAKKFLALEDEIQSAIGLQAFRMDGAEATLEEFTRRVGEVEARLDAGVREDVAELVEQTMRSDNDEWLAYLRAVARKVAASGQADPTRHLIIRRLRDLTPAHMERLRVLATPGRAREPRTALEEALVAAGFADMITQVSGGRGGIVPGVHSQAVLQVNEIGREALRMVFE